MKKYKVRVEQIKEYEIEIDETKFVEKDIESFETAMWKLDKVENDKYASIAHEIANIRAQDLSYEGFGYPLEDRKNYFHDGCENQAINFSNIDEDYIDIEVEEIK